MEELRVGLLLPDMLHFPHLFGWSNVFENVGSSRKYI